MASEKELLERIRELEHQNSVLQDKLDMIWSVLAADYDDGADGEEDDEEPESDGRLVQIDKAPHGKKPQ